MEMHTKITIKKTKLTLHFTFGYRRVFIFAAAKHILHYMLTDVSIKYFIEFRVN